MYIWQRYLSSFEPIQCFIFNTDYSFSPELWETENKSQCICHQFGCSWHSCSNSCSVLQHYWWVRSYKLTKHSKWTIKYLINFPNLPKQHRNITRMAASWSSSQILYERNIFWKQYMHSWNKYEYHQHSLKLIQKVLKPWYFPFLSSPRTSSGNVVYYQFNMWW